IIAATHRRDRRRYIRAVRRLEPVILSAAKNLRLVRVQDETLRCAQRDQKPCGKLPSKTGEAAMTTHQFTPTHYHTAIGSHQPVLRIAPGDTVITTTVDAGGHDARNEQVAPFGNPQTGP